MRSGSRQTNVPQTLAYRLELAENLRKEIGCASFCALFFVCIAALLYVAAPFEEEQSEQQLLRNVAFGVGGFGLLISIVVVKRAATLRIPPTIVEMDELKIIAGQPFRICLKQPGPVQLRSLRANLVGMKVVEHLSDQTTVDWKRYETETRTLKFEENILDVRNLSISRDEVWEQVIETTIRIGSVDAPHAENVKLTWTLEVWGTVRWWPDFYYPFRIEVLPASLTET